MPLSLLALDGQLAQLEVAVEERERLLLVGGKPLKLETQLLQQQLARAKAMVEEGGSAVATRRHTYAELVARLQSDVLFAVEGYVLLDEVPAAAPVAAPAAVPAAAPKSVRFKDNLEEPAPFRPYRDELLLEEEGSGPQDLFAGRSESEETGAPSSDRDVFVQQQVQMLAQDDDIAALARLVAVQHSMGLTLSGELDEQNIMLGDMEAQLDASDAKLRRAHARLDTFRRERLNSGHWWTILVLTVILILLLVVLG